MARPLKEINWDLVIRKMEAGCTAKEIYSESFAECDKETFYRRFKGHFGYSFGDYSTRHAEKGTGDLKLMQHAKAMQGNITMLTWLGKVRLGQKEPESTTLVAANQAFIDQSHLIMQLQHEIAELKANANKSKTE